MPALRENSLFCLKSTDLFRKISSQAPYGRRGRESNPRIEVLQTSALPLGYPAGERISSIAFNRSVSTCKETEFEESKELQEFRVRSVSGASGLAGIERLNGVSPRQVERLLSHSELLQLLGLLELLFLAAIPVFLSSTASKCDSRSSRR
jgi:hypothetical protein